jgi:hypothetical protein
MDKFPECFQRFSRTVNVDRIVSFRRLRLAFGSWAGYRWQETPWSLHAEALELALALCLISIID